MRPGAALVNLSARRKAAAARCWRRCGCCVELRDEGEKEDRAATELHGDARGAVMVGGRLMVIRACGDGREEVRRGSPERERPTAAAALV